MTPLVLLAMAIRDFAGRVLAHSKPRRARHPRSRRPTVVPPPVMLGVHLLPNFDEASGVQCPCSSHTNYVELVNIGGFSYQAALVNSQGTPLIGRVNVNAGANDLTCLLFQDCGAGFLVTGLATDAAWNGSTHYNSGPLTVTWLYNLGSGFITIDLNF